jgi:peptidoglycan/LPS O-acetylase OafA/YrhL
MELKPIRAPTNVSHAFLSFLVGFCHLFPSITITTTGMIVSEKEKKLSGFLLALLPSFLHQFVVDIPHRPTRVSPTAWLDGARGWAAFFVFLRHFEFCYHRKGAISYGTVRDPEHPNENHHLLQLPVLRLLYSGEAMVAIFFVISGYALSLKALKLIRKNSYEQLMRTLASSILRRPLRLYLPCIVSTLIVFFALRIGIYDIPNSIAGPEDVFRSIFLGWAHDPQPQILPTFGEQAKDWVHETLQLFDIFTHQHWPESRYDVHAWSLAQEFKCSMVLFLTIAGLALVRARVRMIFLALFVACAFQADAWELSAFWGGALIAEANLIHQEKKDSRVNSDPFFDEEDSRSQFSIWFTYCSFALSLFLLSYPFQEAEFAPGYATLSKLVPSGLRADEGYRFWHCLGAMIMIYATSFDSRLQSLFTNSVSRYLGNISFALYLMHGFTLKTIGYVSVYGFWQITGKDTLFQYESGFVLGGLVVIPITIWFADLFWRFVDIPIVRFTRWFEHALLPRADEHIGDGSLIEKSPRAHQP